MECKCGSKKFKTTRVVIETVIVEYAANGTRTITADSRNVVDEIGDDTVYCAECGEEVSM